MFFVFKVSIFVVEVWFGILFLLSYKQFLFVSNGFLMFGNYISILFLVELIQLFGNENVMIVFDWRSMFEEEVLEDELWLMVCFGDVIQLFGLFGKGEDFVLLDLMFMYFGEENEIVIYWI